MRIKWDKEKFIKESKKIHGSKYNYSQCNYIDRDSKVKIICPLHGEFFTWPRGHLQQKVGCTFCSGKPRLNTKKVIKRFEELKTSYDYSKFIYKNSTTKSIILCKIHGEFLQSYNHHYKLKQKCPKCSSIQGGIKQRLNINEFIKRAKEIFGNLYDYSKSKYIKYNIKLEIVCLKHGSFFQSPNSHLRGEGCPQCNFSKGEKIIENYLKNKGINYIFQHTFKNCKFKRKLSFDFYIPHLNTIIEFDGEQHKNPINFFGGETTLNYIITNDKIKNKYCVNNNIKLIRINYKQIDKIEKILNKII